MAEAERIKTTVLVPKGDMTVVESVEDLVDQTSLHKTDAEKILSIMKRREANRMGESRDAIVLLDDWAYEDWSDYDIADNGIILSPFVDDYSEDAYIVESAAEVNETEIDAISPAEVDGKSLTTLVDTVDETDGDFHDEVGEMYLPKSAVTDIVAFEGDL